MCIGKRDVCMRAPENRVTLPTNDMEFMLRFSVSAYVQHTILTGKHLGHHLFHTEGVHTLSGWLVLHVHIDHMERSVGETFCNFFLAREHAAKLKAISNVFHRREITDVITAA